MYLLPAAKPMFVKLPDASPLFYTLDKDISRFDLKADRTRANIRIPATVRNSMFVGSGEDYFYLSGQRFPVRGLLASGLWRRLLCCTIRKSAFVECEFRGFGRKVVSGHDWRGELLFKVFTCRKIGDIDYGSA